MMTSQSHGKTLAKFAPEFRWRRIDGFRLVVVTDEALEVELGMSHAATRAKLLRLLDERLRVDAGRLTGPALDQLSGTELSEFILDMFHAADADRNGVLVRACVRACDVRDAAPLGCTVWRTGGHTNSSLGVGRVSVQDARQVGILAKLTRKQHLGVLVFMQDRKEFKDCLGATYLNLSRQEVLRIMVEADENEDGILDYQEFTPLMMNLIRMAGARQKAHHAKVHRAAAAQAEAGRLVKGMRKQELEALMQVDSYPYLPRHAISPLRFLRGQALETSRISLVRSANADGTIAAQGSQPR